MAPRVLCKGCGKQIYQEFKRCPRCGAEQERVSFASRFSRAKRDDEPHQLRPAGAVAYKSKYVAAMYAFLLGIIGGQWFYLGKKRRFLYLLFFWTGLPFLISLFTGLVFLVYNRQAWDAKYNAEATGRVSVAAIGGIFVAPFLSFLFLFLGLMLLGGYEQDTTLSKVEKALEAAEPLLESIDCHYDYNGEYPENNMSDLVTIPDSEYVSEFWVRDGQVEIVLSSKVSEVEGRTIILKPTRVMDGLSWEIVGGTLDKEYWPEGAL